MVHAQAKRVVVRFDASIQPVRQLGIERRTLAQPERRAVAEVRGEILIAFALQQPPAVRRDKLRACRLLCPT